MSRSAIAIIYLLILPACCAIPVSESRREYKPPGVGAEAPDFWLKNQNQLRASLSDFAGKKNVIIVFFPLAFTPV